MNPGPKTTWPLPLLLLSLLLLAGMFFFYNSNNKDKSSVADLGNYNQLLEQVDSGNIQSATIYAGGKVEGIFRDAAYGMKTFESNISQSMIQDFTDKLNSSPQKPKEIFFLPDPVASPWPMLLISALPFLLMIGFFAFMMRQVQNTGRSTMSFVKSKAKLVSQHKKITFNDVAGQDEAKEELQEIIEFLKQPQKFQKLGGKIPKGVLLVGPPGTGKTLVARAVAGEANVPFFSISGSDFIELFVGVGASRVRDLFEQGKKNAPCIIFMDEIDAVGRHRGAGLGGGHDEREQTLNQLLVEMDGFESNTGVIMIAATNRPDILDPALLRPGRFDRRVVFNNPDIKGRLEILKIHTRFIPKDNDADLDQIAKGTPGLSGADLANLVNEAALNATKHNQKTVTNEDFEFAKDKVIMGGERRSMIISDEERRITAIHEAGHAILAVLLPNADPLHKVTIIPRGMALGLTQQLPIDDKYNYSKEYLDDHIAVLLGGRIAEELIIGQITTGAGNDLERVTEIARKMVCQWGMGSKEMGFLTFGKHEEEIFLGREITRRQGYSELTAVKIDHEVKRIVNERYLLAKSILENRKSAIINVSRELLDNETATGKQIKKIILDSEQLMNLESSNS